MPTCGKTGPKTGPVSLMALNKKRPGKGRTSEYKLLLQNLVNLSESIWRIHKPWRGRCMNWLLAVGVLGLIMGGCATPGELMKQQPVVEYVSQKEPRVVVACITKKWSDYGYMLNTLLTEKGYILSRMQDSMYAYATVGVEPEGVGSRVRYSERIFDIIPVETSKAVRECQ
jgi:hypothetical protein